MEEKKKGLDLVSIRLKKDRTIKAGRTVLTSKDAVAFMQEELSDYDREAIVVLNLNVKGKPINASIPSLELLNSSIAHSIRSRYIFQF